MTTEFVCFSTEMMPLRPHLSSHNSVSYFEEILLYQFCAEVNLKTMKGRNQILYNINFFQG